MKRILTTENKQRLCEMAKAAAGDCYDFSAQEAELAAGLEAERAFAKELAARVMNDDICVNVRVCGNIIYIESTNGEKYAVSVNKHK